PLLEKLIAKCNPTVLNFNDEVKRLADLYISKGIISEKRKDDATHIAYSAYYEMDLLLSWNYKYLSNVIKKYRIAAANLWEGYNKPLDLATPMVAAGEG
ncbi:MAG: hypothetical protein V1647_00120, partial [Pseudomonadota bacterium]